MNTRISDEILKKCGLLIPFKSGTKKVFTDITTSQINFDQIINERPDYWEKQGGQKFKALTLIITDWSYQYSSNFNRTEKSHLENLLEQGFEFYAWIGKLKKITSKLSFREHIVKIEPIHHDEMINHLSKKGMEADRVKIIDYFENRKIINTIENKPVDTSINTLNIEEISTQLYQKTYHAIFNSLPQQPITINLVITNYDAEATIKLKIALAEKFIAHPETKNIIFKCERNETEKSNESYYNYYKNFITKYGVRINKLTINRNLLSQIKHTTELENLTINQCDNFSPNDFILLTTALKKLKKLQLYQCKNLENLPPFNFDLIKEIHIIDCSEKGDFLEQLINQCPNIETLIIQELESKTKNNEFPIKEAAFKNIKYLSISNKIENTKIKKVPHHYCTQLEKFELKNFNLNSTDSFDLSKRKIKFISLENVFLTFSQLKNLTHSPQLEEITLLDIRIVDTKNITTIQNNPLNYLRKLHIKSISTTTPELLLYFINQSLLLEEIIIDVDILDEDYFNKLVLCRNLKKLTIFSTIANINCTNSIIEENKNLEELKISSKYFTFLFFHKKHRELTVNMDYINLDSFTKCLMQSPSIRHLELFGNEEESYGQYYNFIRSSDFKKDKIKQIKFLTSFLEDDVIQFLKAMPKIESITMMELQISKYELSLGEKTISLNFLNSLIDKFPEISLITTSKTTIMNDEIIELKKLDKLISLNLNNTLSNSNKFINQFLSASPNLKTLCISEHDFSDFKINVKKLKYLKKIKLDSNMKLTPSIINGFLNLSDNIQHLDLRFTKPLSHPNFVQEITIPNTLKSFSFIENKNSPDQKERELTCQILMKNLEKNFPIMTKIIINNSINYLRKNELTISCINLPEESIFTLLNLSQSIKRLKLIDCQNNLEQLFKNLIFNEIEVLEISKENLPLKKMMPLLEIAPAADFNIRSTDDRLSYSNGRLILISAMIEADFVIKCLKKYPAIQILKIIGTIQGDLSCDDLSLPHLHKVSITDTPSLMNNLPAFYKMSNSITQLKSNDIHIHALDKNNGYSISYLDSKDDGLDLLLSFIDAMPEIEKLHIANGIFKEESIKNAVDLPNLKFIEFRNCEITEIVLIDFLYNCPNLVELNLSLNHNYKSETKIQINDYHFKFGGPLISSNLSDFLFEKFQKSAGTYQFENCYLSEWPIDTSQNRMILDISLINCNASYDFLIQLIKKSVYLSKVTITNCLFISKWKIDELKSVFPAIQFDYYEPIQNKKMLNSSYNEYYSGSRPSLEIEDLIDADTDCPGRPSATPIFLLKKHGQPLPNYYRLDIKTNIKPKIKILSDFTTSENIQAQYELNYENDNQHFYGRTKINGKKNKWIALPSLTPTEQLQALETSSKITVGYSVADNRYYVKPENSGELLLEFILNTHVTIDFRPDNFSDNLENKPYLDCLQSFNYMNHSIKSNTEHFKIFFDKTEKDKIAILIDFCRGFKIEKLKSQCTNKTEVLAALIHERKGVCRHAAAVFMVFSPILNINARLVSNDLHAFVEILIDNTWKMVCLGGAPSLENDHALLNLSTLKSNKFMTPKKSLSTKIKHDNQSLKIHPEPSKRFIYYYSNPFITWNQPQKLHINNFHDLCLHTMKIASQLQSGEKNILLSFTSMQAIEAFHQAMASHTHSQNHQYHYLSSFDDLMMKEMVIDNSSGTYITQESEMLRSIRKKNLGDVFIYNLDNYKNTSVVDSNTLTDSKNRSLRRVPLDPNLTVIAVKLISTRVGRDVRSRFSYKLNCPHFEKNIFNHLLTPIDTLPADFNPECVIDFYNGDHWREQLCGMPTVNGNQYAYKKGALIKMLERGDHVLAFYNPPYACSDFRLFLSTLLSSHRLYINGIHYYLPKNLVIYSLTKDYDLVNQDYHYVIEGHSQSCHWQYELNESTYFHFIGNYECRDELLFKKPGWIKSHQGEVLEIYVTDSFSNASFAQLLEEAKNTCQLKFIFSPSIPIPSKMLARMKASPIKSMHHSKNHIIVSNDCDFTELKLYKSNPDKIKIFSINENSSFADLIETVSIDKKNHQLQFKSHVGCVRKALKKGDLVVLKGKIGKELAHKMQSLFSDHPYLFVNGKKETYPGQLILLSDENNFLTAIDPIVEQHQETDFYTELSPVFNADLIASFKMNAENFMLDAKKAGINIHFSYDQLKRMLHLLSLYPEMNPFIPMLRMHEKQSLLIPLAQSFYPEKKSNPTTKKAFDAYRLNLVNQILAVSPYVFIMGNSGVGKSSFVLKEFAGENLHTGYKKIGEWIKQGGILFLDEANSDFHDCLDFIEGMFNLTPTVLNDKKAFPILNHKIICAGNPNHYGNRKTPSLFRHGAIVQFDEFPDWYLKNEIIKPALRKLPHDFKNHESEIIDCFMNTYQFVNQHQPRCLLTPRNLENMVLRFAYFIEKQEIKTAMWLSAYDEVGNITDEPLATQLKTWINAAHPVSKLIRKLNATITLPHSSFILTESRRNILRLLQIQLALSDMGGTQGLLLEGNPGIGKSQIVIEYLKSIGYQDAENANHDFKSFHAYYYISPDDDRDEIKNRLNTAFHQGAVVIIDEFSSFDIEDSLNVFMSGVDLSGKPANHPGFFVIGTQNPTSFQGRKQISPAVENRTHRLIVSDYDTMELTEIAVKKQVNETYASRLARYFSESVEEGHSHHIPDTPTFREFERQVENVKINNPMSWLPNRFYEYLILILPDQDLMSLCLASKIFAPIMECELNANRIEPINHNPRLFFNTDSVDPPNESISKKNFS